MSFGLDNNASEDAECGREPKKARIEDEQGSSPVVIVSPEFKLCQQLLVSTDGRSIPTIPKSLIEGVGKTKNDVTMLRKVFDSHGFRTSVIASPREALSVYKDSCHVEEEQEEEEDAKNSLLPGKVFLVSLFGLHPNQIAIERFYTSYFKNIYCLFLFCKRIREACPKAVDDEKFAKVLAENEELYSIFKLGKGDQKYLEDIAAVSSSVPERVMSLIHLVVQTEPRNRVEQLEHEYQRIALWNSTLSNALVTLFLKEHDCCIKDVYFKRSHQSKFERITIYLYDPNIDHYKPPHFLFMPSINTAMEKGIEAIVGEMINSFWSHLLRHGYFATMIMKENLREDLESFFLSGISHDVKIPLQLNAHFDPNSALSLYLHGKAGAGKSSFVRNFQPALEATIEEHVDPEILARFVKQNLNKPYSVLQLELELRPNNNDLSVMSIIQGRRMTMGQSKPGLVVVDLEEMPSDDKDADPNQLKVSQLISQRFSGRNGDFSNQNKAPRNSDKRGIQNDASLINIMTSNYELETHSKEALQRLPLFKNLSTHEFTAVSGADRVHFADSYLAQCIKDRFSDSTIECVIQLNIPIEEGDTRPLVRHLRMIAFYICELLTDSMKRNRRVQANVLQNDSYCNIQVGTESIQLKLGTMENLFPVTPRSFNTQVESAIGELQKRLGDQCDLSELSTILDFWLAKTLAPAVVISHDANKIKNLIEAVGALCNIKSVADVNAEEYKMMKSLYDPTDTPNLRDDILKFGKGAFVAVGINCPSKDSQLCIREIIEDSPSMTAFSTSKSALYKSGLLFAVYVNGNITPEVKSRASIII